MSMSKLGFLVAALMIGCGGGTEADGQQPLDEASGFAGSDALAGVAGSVVSSGGSDAAAGQSSGGSAGEAPAITGGGGQVSTAGSGGTPEAGGAGAATAGQATGGGGTGGSSAGTGGTLQGGGGGEQPAEVLILELVAPNSTYQSQYNYELDPTASFSFTFAGFSENDQQFPQTVCHVLLNDPVANHFTGERSGVMPGVAAPCVSAPSTRVSFHFRLNASLDGGGSFRVLSDEEVTALSGYEVTRWEYEVTDNDWVTLSTMPNVYKWDAGARLRIYGTP